MDAGHIAPGTVEEKSIVDVEAKDLEGFGQCHFFAGVGVWSHALRLAGVPDLAAVWTGSCPCQPLSVAGARRGAADARHLWPAWFRLIRQRRPAAIFGEQVASRPGLAWFDAVRADLEAEGYAVAAADLCAAGVGAPHLRQRLFFVAHAIGAGLEFLGPRGLHGEGAPGNHADRCGQSGGGAMGDPDRVGLGARGAPEAAQGPPRRRRVIGAEFRGDAGGAGAVAIASSPGLEGAERAELAGPADRRSYADPSRRGFVAGFWADAEWVLCRPERDGKPWTIRPVEPGTFPVADGAPARVGRLRAFGNAIVSEAAAEFVKAAMETILSQAPE